MAKRLKVQLFSKWQDISADNPDGPPTYTREGGSNALQISYAEYTGGKPPNPDEKTLIDIAVGWGGKDKKLGQCVGRTSGACAFGHFGAALFTHPEHPRIQVWVISNGRDFIFVTHICGELPEPAEVAEAHEIACRLLLK